MKIKSTRACKTHHEIKSTRACKTHHEIKSTRACETHHAHTHCSIHMSIQPTSEKTKWKPCKGVIPRDIWHVSYVTLWAGACALQDIQKIAQKQLEKPSRTATFDVLKYLPASKITSGLVNAISTGNWNLRRFGMEKQGVTQVPATCRVHSGLPHVVCTVACHMSCAQWPATCRVHSGLPHVVCTVASHGIRRAHVQEISKLAESLHPACAHRVLHGLLVVRMVQLVLCGGNSVTAGLL